MCFVFECWVVMVKGVMGAVEGMGWDGGVVGVEWDNKIRVTLFSIF